jgi:hypothetical protein
MGCDSPSVEVKNNPIFTGAFGFNGSCAVQSHGEFDETAYNNVSQATVILRRD